MVPPVDPDTAYRELCRGNLGQVAVLEVVLSTGLVDSESMSRAMPAAPRNSVIAWSSLIIFTNLGHAPPREHLVRPEGFIEILLLRRLGLAVRSP